MITRTQNPTEGGKEPKSFGANHNVREDSLGFINRNQNTSRTIAAPDLSFPIGVDFNRDVGAVNALPTTTNAAKRFANWSKGGAYDTSIPGIMIYEFDPVFMNTDSFGQHSIADIFVNRWIEIRQVYTGADNFQPGDIQLISQALMLIYMYAEEARRFINMIGAISANPENHFLGIEAMTAACGFAMTDYDARRNYTEWINYYNDSILGKLSKLRWLDNLVPGRKRWGSLCREFYKDADFKTDNVQISMLRPRFFWKFEEEIDPETEAVTYTFYNFSYHEELDPKLGATAFRDFLTQISGMIHKIFYDSGAINVMNGIIAMINRGNAKNGGDVPIYNVPEDFTPVSYETKEFTLTYDATMLLALHNATILDGLKAGKPHLDPKTGNITQVIAPYDETYAAYLSYFSKVLNSPTMQMSNSDFAAITQWTVASQVFPRDVVETGYPEWTLGTDVITSCRILKYKWVGDPENPGQQIWGLYPVYIHQILFPEDEFYPEPFVDITEQIAMCSAFNLAPLLYRAHRGSGGELKVERVIGEIEIPYIADQQSLKNIHKVFVQNFWGYPISPVLGEGSPELNLDNAMREVNRT